MALTLPRWIAAATAGCLIITASFFSKAPKPAPEPGRRATLAWASNSAANAANSAITTLRALQLRDSVRAAIKRLPPSDSSRILVSPAVPERLRGYDRVLATRLSMLRAQRRSGAIDLAFVADTSYSLRRALLYRSLMGVTHALPMAPNERCISIVRHQIYNQNMLRSWPTYLTSASTAARVLGPCGFYEAFGSPGAGIDKWLTNGAWRFGTLATIRSGPTRQLDLEAYNYAQPLWAENSGWPLRLYVSVSGYRCAAGDADACRRLVLDPNSDPQGRRIARIFQDGLVAYTSATDDELFLSMGPGEPQYLADMSNILGPDRFRAFWKSDKPVAEAFQAATGQDIGAWTADWARLRYGVNRRGPGADAWTATISMLLTLAGLAAAIATSRRRQMA